MPIWNQPTVGDVPERVEPALPRNYSVTLTMTTPRERTKAVIETRKFLQMLASTDEVASDGDVQSVAERLLRHYPLDIDLEVSAAALPEIWAASKANGTHHDC